MKQALFTLVLLTVSAFACAQHPTLKQRMRQLQEQLQRISRAYPAIPSITPDGVYGNRTKEAVQKFQSVFGLPVTGVVDYPTWYKISDIYVAVSRIAELR